MSLLPSRLNVSSSPDEPRVLDIDGDAAGETFDALGSETARDIVSLIYDDPRTPAELEDHVGTSLQNVHYHVDRLEDADLIEPAGTGYSEKGNEMTVYGPASEAVVLFAGEDGDSSRLRDALTRLFGLALTVGIATAVFAVVHIWLTREPEQTETFTASDAQSGAESGAAALTSLDPVLAFFLGACIVAVAVAAWWYLDGRL